MIHSIIWGFVALCAIAIVHDLGKRFWQNEELSREIARLGENLRGQQAQLAHHGEQINKLKAAVRSA